MWYDDHGTVQNIGPDWRLIIIVVVLYQPLVHTMYTRGLSFLMSVKNSLGKSKTLFVDDDDAEVESQICHVKLMNDSVCQILGGL